MHNFAVYTNKYKDKNMTVTESVKRKLAQTGCECAVFEDINYADLSGFDCVIALGGDGTIIEAAKKAAEYGLGVIGVNLGKIGYLASLEVGDIDMLDIIINKPIVQIRTMFDVEYRDKTYKALNDVVIAEQRASRMVSVSIKADGKQFTEYRSTAVIFSTATGSSGFNISAGGPVMDPELDCFAVTPVCPHTTEKNSFIFSGNTKILAQNTSTPDKTVIMTIDGACDLPLDEYEAVTIRRSEKCVKLYRLYSEPFAATLMKKMKV